MFDAKSVPPCGPCGPVLPCGPCGPVLPVSPFAPCGPCGPVLPVSPFAPVGPVAPVAPVAPVFPLGIVNANVRFVDEPPSVTEALVPAAPVVVLTELIVAAAPVAPVSPFGRVKDISIPEPDTLFAIVTPAFKPAVAETPTDDVFNISDTLGISSLSATSFEPM